MATHFVFQEETRHGPNLKEHRSNARSLDPKVAENHSDIIGIGPEQAGPRKPQKQSLMIGSITVTNKVEDAGHPCLTPARPMKAKVIRPPKPK